MKFWALTLCLSLLLASSASAFEFKILSLNCWTMPFAAKKVYSRTKIISTNIHNYDFIGLQEVWLPWHRAWVRKFGPKKYTNIFQKKPFFKVGMGSGLFNLTKYKIIRSGFIQFDSCSGIDCWAAKGVLFVRIELPEGQQVDIFNTHLQAGGDKAPQVRKDQLIQMVDYINFHDRGNPTIVMGDFNVSDQTDELPTLQLAMTGFKDIWTTTHPSLPGYTSDSNTNPWTSSGQRRLDYIFIKDGNNQKLKIKNVELAFNKPMKAKGSKEELIASDHFGVEATVELESLLELAKK